MSRGLTGSLLVCVAAAGVAVGALALDAGGDEDSGDALGDPAGDGTPQPLVIDDFTFSAATVAPGQTVGVDNRDDVPHTVTANDGSFTTDTIDAAGTSSFVAPTTPGTYQFRCTIHPEMSGALTVRATQPAEGVPGTGETDMGNPGKTEETPGY